MIRAVLDANVFVSALIRPAGVPGRLLARLIRDQAFQLVISPAILDEIKRSIAYPRVQRYLSAPREDLALWVDSLGIVGDLVGGDLEVRAVPSDPDDDKYIAAAIEGRASHIVTGDRHLLDLGTYDEIQIVSPRAFLGLLTR